MTVILITGACCVAAVAVTAWLIVRLTRDLGRHVADPLAGAGLIVNAASEVHHEEYLSAPTRGDAQGRAVRVCAPESRPAARADLTGSLSPHHEERPGPVSAPPDPGTPGMGPDGHATAPGGHLLPVTTAAVIAVTALRHLAVEAADPAHERWPWDGYSDWHWAGDDTLTSMRAIRAGT